MSVRIYHNPRCSKSRQTLQLLREQGLQPEVIEYLKTPLDVDELRRLASMLGVAPLQMVRHREVEFRTAGLDRGDPDDDTVLAAIRAHPRLLERPIVVNGDRAAIGRPPEQVLSIL